MQEKHRPEILARNIANITHEQPEVVQARIDQIRKTNESITNTEIFHSECDGQSSQSKQDTHIKRQK